MKRIFQKGKQGFTLPMVTIAIAALSLLLVALQTILSLERKTARAYSEISRAELAAESGLAVALKSLTEISQRDDGLVFRIDDPSQPKIPSSERPLGYREQFFTYASLFDANEWRIIPLFSGAKEEDLGNARRIDATALQTELSSYVNDRNTTTLTQLTEHDQNIPRAKWVEVPSPDSSTDYHLRYAYWIEDLAGRIDGKNAASKARAEGESAEEIQYATILDPISDTPALPPELIAARSKLRSSASLRQILSANEAKRLEPYIHFYGTAPAPPAPTLIPHGFSYPDAGQPAPDLNEFVTNQDVEGIAAHIARQIPSFETRKGDFPEGEDYLKTIAASIIDYADTDSDATTGTGYRGIDSYPFVNEIADRYEWLKASPDGEVWIKVETYIELWNPSQQSITGEIEFTNVNRHKIQKRAEDKITVLLEKQFSNAKSVPQTVSLPPNGFLVIKICTETYRYSDFGTIPHDQLYFVGPLDNEDDIGESTFLLKWNGKLVDTARGGLRRTGGLLRQGLDDCKWKANGSPAHNWDSGQAGDPRSSWYINTNVYFSSYAESTNWGGRALKRNVSALKPYREVRLDKWPDRGSNSIPGIHPETDARIPTNTKIILKSTGEAIAEKNYPPNEPDKAPAFISNAGRYTSLGELGHIFDPAQWLNVESSSDAKGDPKSGGGMTLAIGRPEFGAFETDEHWRAARLLDLFSLPSKKPITTPINLNTAPREVLRTLMADVSLDDDPVATSVKLKKQTEIGDLFADFIIAHRNSCPLRSLSDLNNLRMNPLLPRDPANPEHTPFFGNDSHFENAPKIMDPATDSTEWDDAGREELFRKVMNLVSFRSKMFRIVVAGEVHSKQGQLLSRSTREVHLSIEPERNAKGFTIPGVNPRIIKHFERVLSSP